MKELSQIEEQFLSFIAEQQAKPKDLLKCHYLSLKKRFHPHGNRFRHFSEEFIRLHDFFFNIDHATDYIKLYQHHAYISMFRFLSYSNRGASLFGNVAYFFKLAFTGELRRALCSVRREFEKKSHRGTPPDITHLARERFERIVLLDYGCGLAYRSLELALALGDKLDRLVLVDIPSLILDFTTHRARQAGIVVERIEVTPEHPYPTLPSHHICIANEVVEHVKEPLRLLNHLALAQANGAFLFGDYDDHCPEIYHLHTDLSTFRRELQKTHCPLGADWYEKRGK